MKLKLGHKFLIMSFLVILVSIGIVTGLGLFKIEKNSAELALQSLQHRVLTMEYFLSKEGELSIQDGRLVAGDYVIDGNEELVDQIKTIYGGTATIFRDDIRVSTNVKKDDGSRAVGTKLTGPAYDAVFKNNASFSGEVDILGVPYYTCYKPLKDSGGRTLGVLYAGVMKSEFMHNYYAMVREVVGASCVLIVFFCVLVYFYSRRITSILARVSLFADNLAKGDLQSGITISTGDELEHMAKSLDGMRVHLSGVISDISKVSMSLSSSSEQLSASSENSAGTAQSGAASTEEMTATIEEVYGGMENIDTSASHQLDCIETLRGRLAVLSEVANETSVKLRKTGENTSNINVQAETGGKLLDSMIQTMQQISSGSQEMLNITTIINDISDKINLLSLNASIEAARAGEAGRGFAVVAEEISKLADQTASSIKNIDTLIRDNNAEITSGLGKVKETVTAITNIVDGVESISSMMNSLFETIRKLEDSRLAVEQDASGVIQNADEIKTATGEQKLAMSEMVKSVSNLTDVTQGVASGAEELSSSSEEIATMAEQLRGKVDYFKIS